MLFRSIKYISRWYTGEITVITLRKAEREAGEVVGRKSGLVKTVLYWGLNIYVVFFSVSGRAPK